jgi:hypothetical protein
MSDAQRAEIRTEVCEALASEGGWTKAALAKFRKLDSLLREVGRVHGLSGGQCLIICHVLVVSYGFFPQTVGMNRLTVVDGTLPDGTFVPAGYLVVVDLFRAHMNPDVYPDPEVFDPFRFSKLRETVGGDAKNGFTTVDKNVKTHFCLPFIEHGC